MDAGERGGLVAMAAVMFSVERSQILVVVINIIMKWTRVTAALHTQQSDSVVDLIITWEVYYKPLKKNKISILLIIAIETLTIPCGHCIAQSFWGMSHCG